MGTGIIKLEKIQLCYIGVSRFWYKPRKINQAYLNDLPREASLKFKEFHCINSDYNGFGGGLRLPCNEALVNKF